MSVIRHAERKRAAALRAVSGNPTAELRGVRLTTSAGPVPVNSPFLALASDDKHDAERGVADALALIVCHNDPALHRRLRPEDPIERIVFDGLEQLRCLSLAPDLAGVRANRASVIDAWCRQARADGVAESGLGLLVYTVMHMARARLGLGLTDEHVDAVIEGPRARLARLVGHALAQLAPNAKSQGEFAEPAREIARLVAEMAADTTHSAGEAEPARFRMLAPLDWFDEAEGPTGSSSAPVPAATAESHDASALHALGGYRVFTRAHDVVLEGSELYPPSQLRRARTRLDEGVRGQAVSARRLGLRLAAIFGSPVDDARWHGLPEGEIDRRRLAQLVTSVDPQNLFQQPRPRRQPDTAVTLLVDQSGSMKSHRYETVAVLVDTLSRALDLAGITNEVLGHTTQSWAGGQSMADWKQAGRPDLPGRVADLAHIVYKSADTPWRRARRSLGATVMTRHFRESVDGEAVIWAHQRLLTRPEPRKVLVVVSDGAPAESGTALAHAEPGLLGSHLARVVAAIEGSSPVEIAALSAGGAVDSVFANSVRIDLDTTLSLAEYRSLEALFATTTRR